jgi:glycerol-3-phosphate dehydrogenase
VAAHLAGRYGSETPDVLAVTADRPELLDPLVPGLRYLEAEAVYAVEHEMATSVADVLDRRTRASLRDARGAADAALRVATLIGPILGWDALRITNEAESYAAALRAELVQAGLEVDPGPGRLIDAATTASEPG